MSFKKHTLKWLIGGFVIGFAALGIVQCMIHATGTPAFCGQCHYMEHEAKTFAQSPHRKLDCVECHLPHDNTAHYLFEKGRTGMVDVYHAAMRDYPDRIKLGADSRMMVEENCYRCHGATMSYIESAPGEAPQNCLKCHSKVAHGANHLEGGIKVE